MSQEEFIIGRNPVLEALRSEREINKVWMAENSIKGSAGQITAVAKEKGIIVQTVPKRKLDQMVEGNHQGFVASVAAYAYSEIDDILNAAEEKGEAPFIMILDELEDPHNLGSIMRTADAAGVHGIIIPKRRAVGLTATVAKASTGAIEYVPVARVTNLSRAIEELKEKGVWIAGTDAKGSDDYRTLDGTMAIGLVIGSEGKGVSRLVREKCDFLINLPMAGHVTSLNASVAASLLMYEVYRKRHPLEG
ncbi:23S rRNA (guanosine(2251)-2'-O)-methyltransferase RlmB [Bacillus mangrovi]|uniref:23S rRNA (Guanosine(2251)-2'-O)-methyltransferase RlmB n=1 Tax=Metabacillus mangrovi TaxID=1491830 RepID=A0A7X2S857_9BACI|nr:23S rRNA (guanosine(2251)-2'-O)-methyltransferase RlmB [Metabacillus mangrovi]MTH55147.1 23S rRNA (guanosine(2251)-2'-O)-methyltransferase RlmB [Metabacillus mangrovi]